MIMVSRTVLGGQIFDSTGVKTINFNSIGTDVEVQVIVYAEAISYRQVLVSYYKINQL